MNIQTNEYDFDDLLLCPRPSIINSRNDVDLSPVPDNIFGLKFPIFSAPMKGISGINLVKELGKLGGLGILHRFWDSEGELETLIYDNLMFTPYGISIGLNATDQHIEKLLDFNPFVICVDVANGYLFKVLKFCEKVSKLINNLGYETRLMAGNVVTREGYRNMETVGVDLIRVGIGSGQLCTTRNNTGIGRPQLSAIDDCASFGAYPSLIADGGIRSAGDAIKALAMGANYIMIGSLFGQTHEAENNDGIIYGMASKHLQEDYYHGVKSIEGIHKVIEQNTSLTEFIDGFTMNMKSACTYLDAQNLLELRDNATWIEVGKGTIDWSKK